MKLLLDIGQKTTKFALLQDKRKVLRAGLEDSDILLFPKSLEEVLPQLPLKKEEPLNVSVLFSPGICKARQATFELQRKNPTEVISALEEKIVESQAELKIQSEVEKALLYEFGILPRDFLFLRFSILRRTVDGYLVDHVKGLQGEKLSFEGLGIFCLRTYWEKLLSFFARHRVEKFTLLCEALCVLEFSRKGNQDGAFIDIGEKVTHMCVVSDEHIVALEEIPYGGWEFTSAIENAFGMTENKAEELKKDYAQGLLAEEFRQRIGMIFLSHAKKLGTMVQEKLVKVRFPMGNPVFLYGGGSQLKEIREVFEKKNLRILYPTSMWEGRSFSKASNPQYTPLFLQLYGKE